MSGAPEESSRRRTKMYSRAVRTSRMSTPARISPEITSDMRTALPRDPGSADLRGVDRLGDDDDLVPVDRQEAAVDGGRARAAGGLDPHLALDEDAEQRRVAGQDAQLAVDGAGLHHVRLALPDLAVRGDEFNLQGAHGILRWYGTCRASFSLYPPGAGDRRPVCRGAGRAAGPTVTCCGAGSEVLLDVGPLALDVVEATAHEERLLGDVVVLAVRDLRERLDRVGQRNRRALDAGELLGDVGVLRQEPLDATSAVDEDLVLLGELVDAEDRDDVLQLLVALEDLLDPDRGVVVLGRDVAAVEDSRRRGQRVHGRVDAERGDLTRELGGRVEVRERRGRGRVGVVVQDRKSTR